MTSYLLFGRTPLASAALMFASILVASEKIDLVRDTPVPADQPIPVQDFFRQPILRDLSVNPSGTYIAGIASSGTDQSVLMTYELASRKLDSIGAYGDSDINAVWWIGDDRVLYQMSAYKMGGFVIAGARLKSLQSSYPVLQIARGDLIAIPPHDRLHPLFHLASHGFTTGQYGEIVNLSAGVENGKILNLAGGDSRLDSVIIARAREDNIRNTFKNYPILETPRGFDLYYLADKEGQLAYGVTSTDGILKLHELQGDHWRDCPEDLDEINVIGAGEHPGEIVALDRRHDNKPRALVVMKATTGEVIDTLVQDKAYDAGGWIFRDPRTQAMVGAVYDRSAYHVTWFNDEYRALQRMVDALFPGQLVQIIGRDEKERVVLIEVTSDRQPAFYRWVNLETRSVADIRQSCPWIDPKRMQPMSAIKYQTREGRSLDAYVVMPAGATKAKPPALVVLPPDGSYSRYIWGYDGLAQFLASRGYAVLLPNHRGSGGTTWMFPTEDEWAYRKMHEDITAATKAMVASGLVDPHRVAIMGTDFGGFLALSGAAYEPDLYRCAVAISPVTDWARLIGDYAVNKDESSYFSRMTRKLGDPKHDPEKWDAISPQKHAGAIKAAIFIATGEYDSPMVISGAHDVASTVEHNHIPVETVSYINESVGVSHLKSEVDLYSRIEAFLARNL
ncbi:MAG TPA: alpha/beta fold hydrolase [Candidatus Didemnitutus sp.]|jgi:dienelactone hydrolase